MRLEVFPVRHHWPDTAFGLRLRGSLVWTGDTRPIPEMLAKFADAGELVAHDCALHGNPSHSGIDDLEREYPRELLARCLLYHYASARATARRWPRAAIASPRPGEVVALAEPTAPHAGRTRMNAPAARRTPRSPHAARRCAAGRCATCACR